jgi:hypothetical protein
MSQMFTPRYERWYRYSLPAVCDGADWTSIILVIFEPTSFSNISLLQAFYSLRAMNDVAEVKI